MTCKRVKKITARNIGVIAKSKCCDPIYKDGLCKKHYKQHQNKLINWIDRPNYIESTEDDLIRGRSLKLKNTHVHTLYRFRKGLMEQFSSKDDMWVQTNIKPDNTLFCVKIL